MQTAPIDPRINDNILPDNAVPDEKTYGLRVYSSDIYPGYIWRNCAWHKVTPDLKFDRLGTEWHGNEFISVGDDSVEYLINGRRMFVKKYNYKTTPPQYLSYDTPVTYYSITTYYDPKKKTGWHVRRELGATKPLD